jgi:SNF2 family DNA or RNA helicase
MISPQRDWSSFNSHIAKMQKKKPKLAATRAQAILKSCSIRRNKDTELHGVRLLTLPEKTVEVVELDFTAEERDMYDRIEKRMQVSFVFSFSFATSLVGRVLTV